jgi:glycylpeptide N-tetradecanoyltransferase
MSAPSSDPKLTASSLEAHDAANPPADDAKAVAESLQNLSVDSKKVISQLIQPQMPVPTEFRFWSTQPVPRLDEKPTDHGPIETKKVSDVLQTPYPLPGQFEWCSIDITDNTQVNEVYTLLTENYVEDDDNMFRFDYSREFLQWALMPPGYLKDWHVGVRAITTKKLLGFISAIPADVKVY